jgi:hypothetical protein
VNTVFLSVKYGRILKKCDISRKRSGDAQITFVSISILFYHFRFYYFDNYFHFRLALKMVKF